MDNKQLTEAYGYLEMVILALEEYDEDGHNAELIAAASAALDALMDESARHRSTNSP